MSKSDRKKKRQSRQYAKPSAPRRLVGANDNAPAPANDDGPVIVGGIRLNPALAKTFREAEANLASADKAKQREGAQAMIELEQALASETDARHMKRVRAEIAALERARGGALVTEQARDQRGETGERYRVQRDGLATLLSVGSITTAQHAAGLRFRTDYEMLDPERGLTPPALDQTRKAGRGGDTFAAKRKEVEERVRDLEASIQSADRTCKGALGRSDVERTGRAVWAIREVAGKGSSLRGLSNSGSVIAATGEALRLALDHAAIAYGLD